MTSSRPILVTGSHRSGTGWVARVLSGSPSPVHYLWEPFSVLTRPGICAARFRVWFPYLSVENEEAYLAPVGDTVALRYNLSAELRSLRSPKDVARMLRDRRAMQGAAQAGARALLKDPIALFSAEWLVDRFDAEPIVLIRHPAAFASSIVQHGWRHPLGDFLAQPLLMRDRLESERDEIERFAADEQPLLD
ncbi:MAG: sulfotransferase, partial [Actinomycetota bacterium]